MLERASQLIASFEGFRSAPYQVPGDRSTIGYGNTFYENGQAVTLTDSPITQDRALTLLTHFVSTSLNTVYALVTAPLTDNQKIALTSFQYNTGHIRGSTMLSKLNAGDMPGAADEFNKWTHMNGVVLEGLVARRAQERALFLSPDEAA